MTTRAARKRKSPQSPQSPKLARGTSPDSLYDVLTAWTGIMVSRVAGSTIGDRLARIETALVDLAKPLAAIAKQAAEQGPIPHAETDTALAKIARMIVSGRYQHADAFLRSVYRFGEQAGTITRKQLTAVERIEAGDHRDPCGLAGIDPWEGLTEQDFISP